MWDTHTYWFDMALISGIFAVGNILFGHFEEHRPKWRRLLKLVIVVALAIFLSTFHLRWVTYLLLLSLGVGAGYVHLVWLPRNGINGWTGEPKEKYHELLGVDQPSKTVKSDNTKSRRI